MKKKAKKASASNGDGTWVYVLSATVALVAVIIVALIVSSAQQPQLVDDALALALVGVDATKPVGTTAPGFFPPPPAPTPSGTTAPPPRIDTLANLPWAPVETSTIKGCKVAIVGTKRDPVSDAVYNQRLDSDNLNSNRIYESAFKVEDTANPEATVYYLSQFPDSKLPCAASPADRGKYKKFFRKEIEANGKVQKVVYNESTQPTTGHKCELIRERRAEPPTPGKVVERICSDDPRCAGYYMAYDANNQPMLNLPPILASASPESCKVSWARLPVADLPKTADLCTRYMGDGVWGTNSDECVPTCANDRNRRWTGLCTSTSNSGSDSCLDGWQLSTSSEAKYTCVPVSEQSCPIGWTHQKSGDYPHGVCRPPCVGSNKGPSREEDGFCHYNEDKNWTCLPGTLHKRYGTNTDFCKPSPLDYPAKPAGPAGSLKPGLIGTDAQLAL
jgi:hypothetical protein